MGLRERSATKVTGISSSPFVAGRVMNAALDGVLAVSPPIDVIRTPEGAKTPTSTGSLNPGSVNTRRVVVVVEQDATVRSGGWFRPKGAAIRTGSVVVADFCASVPLSTNPSILSEVSPSGASFAATR